MDLLRRPGEVRGVFRPSWGGGRDQWGRGGGGPGYEGPLLTLSLLQSKYTLRKGFVTLVCPSQPVMAHRGALNPAGYVYVSFDKLPGTEAESAILMRRVQTST